MPAKVWVGTVNEHVVEAELVGLHRDEHGDVSVVIRRKGHGMFVEVLHPSKVSLTKEAE